MSMNIARPDYAAQYGPTTGDRIHLADTGLLAEIEHDFTTYGDELVFGGGKTIRVQEPFVVGAADLNGV